MDIDLEAVDESPYEYGIYIERNDSHDDKEVWVPLVYGEKFSYEEAEESYIRDLQLTFSNPKRYRNAHIVRREVSPWEIVEK